VSSVIKSTASKVMGVGKATVFLMGLAVILALVFGVASRALGADGDFFKVGKSNLAASVSKLVKSGAGPALRLEVDSGPPLSVNSSAKVTNLNADKVDGKNAADFLPASGKAVDSDNLDGLDSSQFLGANQKAVDSDKLDGLDSAQLAVKTGFAAGFGANPSATTQFLAPPAVVAVGAGQAVQVTSNKAFGSTLSGGADSLDLFICHRPEGSTATPTTFGPGIFNNRVAQDTRVTMGISAVISGLPAGSHQVGMCGDADTNANWNNNEFGYTSALVVTPPSGGAAASSTTQIQER
jgi:hypothetical protein